MSEILGWILLGVSLTLFGDFMISRLRRWHGAFPQEPIDQGDDWGVQTATGTDGIVLCAVPWGKGRACRTAEEANSTLVVFMATHYPQKKRRK